LPCCIPLFFFHASAAPEISPLSLHDALPILISTRSLASTLPSSRPLTARLSVVTVALTSPLSSTVSDFFEMILPLTRPWITSSSDRKSTRLNSSHVKISYAVFCLKKKKEEHT